MKFQLYLLGVISVYFVTFGYASRSSEELEEFKSYVEECQKKTGATDDDLEVLLGVYESENKVQACMAACFYKKAGMMDDENKILTEAIIEAFEEVKEEDKDLYDKIVQLINECRKKQTSQKDECAAAEEFLQCTYKLAEELGISEEVPSD